jgi:hypothetical protein
MLLPFARMATTDIIRMRARLTGTTGLAGSTAGCLSERVRGSAAGLDSGRDSDSGGRDLVDLGSVDDRDSAADQDLAVGRESAYVDRLAVASTGMSHVVVTSTAADRVAAVVSTAVVVRTVEVVRMAVAVRTAEATGADTGKIQQ